MALSWVEIDEPKGFDSITFKMERDEQYYGFSPIASVDNLDFDCQTARDFVDEMFRREGTDADLKFVMVVDGYVQIVQSLNYNNYRKNIDYTMLNLENSAFDQKLATKLDTPFEYSLNRPTLLYSKQLPLFDGYTKNTMLLLEDFETKPNPNDITQAYGLFFTPKDGNEIVGIQEYPMQMTFVNPENERKYILKPELGGTYRLKFDTAFFAWNENVFNLLNFGGLQSGEVQGNLGVNATLSLVIKVKDSVSQVVKFSEEINPSEIILRQISSDTEGLARAYDVGRDVNVFKLEREFYLTKQDELYVYLVYLPPFVNSPPTIRQSGLEAWGNQGDQRARIRMVNTCVNPSKSDFFDPTWNIFQNVTVVDDVSEPSLKFVGLTIERPSITNLTPIGSAMREISQQILELDSPEETPFRSLLTEGVSGELESELQIDEEEGELQKFYIGNGFAIKSQIDPDNELTKPRASFRQLIDNARFLVNAGYNVEFDKDGNEVIVVERMEYFFQDRLIMSFPKGDLEEYEEMAIADRVYNEIELGYSRFAKNRETSKTNTIEDPHGVLNFSTPIKRNKNKFELKTDMILSAFELEITRRKQFEKSEGSNSNEKDDSEIYGVQIYEEGFQSVLARPVSIIINPLPIWQYRGANSIVLNGFTGFTPLPFVSGDSVEIFADDILVGTRVIDSTSFGKNQGVFESIITFSTPVNNFTPLVPLDSHLRVTSTVLRALPESSQPFQQVSGIDSPETFYNLRWTPNRVIRNWGKEINAGLTYKEDDEIIKFQKSESNTNLETRFKESEIRNLGDTNKDLIKEGADFPLTGMWAREFKTTAYEVRFKIRRPVDFFNYLIACHQGYSPHDNNYGYLQIEDDEGNVVRGYMVNCEYSPATLELDITIAVSLIFNIYSNISGVVSIPFIESEGSVSFLPESVNISGELVLPIITSSGSVQNILDPVDAPSLIAPTGDNIFYNFVGGDLLWDLYYIEGSGPLNNEYDIQLWFQFFDEEIGFAPNVESYFGGQVYELTSPNPSDPVPEWYPVPPIGVDSMAHEVRNLNGGTLPPTQGNRISVLWRLIRKSDGAPSPFFQNAEYDYEQSIN